MNGREIAASFVFGLLVNEMTDISPWAARRLVHWAAYRWTADPHTAARYAEEWAAIIDERPGKLLKLGTAARFAVGAAGRAAPRALAVLKHRVAYRLWANYHDGYKLLWRSIHIASLVITVATTVIDLAVTDPPVLQWLFTVLQALCFIALVAAYPGRRWLWSLYLRARARWWMSG